MEELDAFTLADVDNYDVINDSSFKKIVQDIIISNATPALWFYAAGGSVLVTLGLMSLIRQWPRGKIPILLAVQELQNLIHCCL